ncbi:agrin-like [Ctenocephalides felis]|uniref:agrin-like n=1 Tax=Ctenocephalides felis TaxID=7515 RepID=UPI000E6E5A0A|nr:agrin-like [Ctenocephalides felis]
MKILWIILFQFFCKLAKNSVDGCYAFSKEKPNPCVNLQCGYGFTCLVTSDGLSASCHCPERCSNFGDHETSRPLCGSDGLTYDNHCEMLRKSCSTGTLITGKHDGRCEEQPSTSTPSLTASSPLPAQMTEQLEQNPDLNEHKQIGEQELEQQMLEQQRHEHHRLKQDWLKFGPKENTHLQQPDDACKDIRCDFSATCELGEDGFPRCVCRFDCENEDFSAEKICASDMRLYKSVCEMAKEACNLQQDLRLRPMELCQGAEVKPCKGDLPIVNPLTGVELNCGNRPFRQDCPSGSYCHQTAAFAKCCRKDDSSLPVKHCSASWFGCCPDGATFATDAEGTGCPSVCNCNKLGSIETGCDPISQQCHCKPGVGGLQCDRCEPGYWGLPKITSGHQGCIPCNCSPYGSVREDCEQMTGRCVCKPEIQGQKCTVCIDHEKVLGPNGCVLQLPATGTDWPLRPYTSFHYTPSDDLNSALSKSTRHLLYPDPREPFTLTHNNMAHAHPEEPALANEYNNVDDEIVDDMNWNYNIPSFDGSSHIRIKPMKAYYKFDVEIEFKTNTNNGIMFYNGQHIDGKGDFISLAIINGYLEFRYNLGNGIVIITSPERLELRCFHTITARRYNQDGELKVDSGYSTAGHSRGKFKALDLKRDGYIGHVRTNFTRIYENIGTDNGFDGCIKKFKINRKLIDLWIEKDDTVLEVVGVKDCVQTPCSNIVCSMNDNITCSFDENEIA